MNDLDMKFIVIIPTRERADTLKWTLKTCVTQAYDNLEIIVSDNFSQDNTYEVVKSYQDSRIKYINTGERVSMSSNWEFALSHINFDENTYVTFIGDDDGLLPNALQEINDLIKKLGDVDAIAWEKAQYTWRNCIFRPNFLSLSLKRKLERLETKETLKKITDFDQSSIGLPYETLPCLYNSFVKSTKIQQVKNHSSSLQFFHSMTPDVYSSIVLSLVIDNHYFSHYPYSVNGASRHSNGTSSMLGKTNEEKQAAEKFVKEIDIPFHSDLVMCSSIPILIAESVLQARDNLNVKVPDVDFAKLIQISFNQSKSSHNYPSILNALNKIAEMHNVRWCLHEVNSGSIGKTIRTIFRKLISPLYSFRLIDGLSLSFRQKIIVIDGNIAKLHNIFDASLLCKDIIERAEQGCYKEYKYSYITSFLKLLRPNYKLNR
jgi:glycosyltransferase involved in cell wall biosynthesis